MKCRILFVFCVRRDEFDGDAAVCAEDCDGPCYFVGYHDGNSDGSIWDMKTWQARTWDTVKKIARAYFFMVGTSLLEVRTLSKRVNHEAKLCV
jgi:hypothetical protein